MDLRQLECLVHVADEGSFTRAAERLRLAQPGVSAHVRHLEAELGAALLDRHGGAVTPTPLGEDVLAHAREALRATERVREAVAASSGLLRGRVRVGVLPGSAPPPLDAALARFHGEHPGVELAVGEHDSGTLLDGLRAGRLDLALLGLADRAPDPEGVELEVVIDVPLVAAVAAGDRLARRQSVPLRDLVERPLLGLPRGGALRESLEAACAAAGLRPVVAVEASEPVRLAALAGRGLGVAVVPESAVLAAGDLVRAVPLARPALRARSALAWRTGGPSGPAGAALRDAIRDAFAGT